MYNKLLNYLEKRKKAIQKSEREFMNIIKVVIDGGWIIRESEIEWIIDNMIEFKEEKSK